MKTTNDFISPWRAENVSLCLPSDRGCEMRVYRRRQSKVEEILLGDGSAAEVDCLCHTPRGQHPQQSVKERVLLHDGFI